MRMSIEKPELLTIKDSHTNSASYGSNQAWYKRNWAKKAGCGACSAANLTAYLAKTRSNLLPLYSPTSMEKSDFIIHMDDLFKYIKPGLLGVNKLSKFSNGLLKFATDRNVEIEIHIFNIDDYKFKSRNIGALATFVKSALDSDSPIAFLNLSRGHEKRLQNWHWITITSVEVIENKLIATASDEGFKRTFDLSLWFMTSRKHGGLIYIK